MTHERVRADLTQQARPGGPEGRPSEVNGQAEASLNSCDGPWPCSSRRETIFAGWSGGREIRAHDGTHSGFKTYTETALTAVLMTPQRVIRPA
jgi:hypothetical protein